MSDQFKQILANLPPKKSGNMYGFTSVLSSYANRCKILAPLPGEIPHGWIYPERNIIPDFIVGTDGLAHTRRTRRLFVARKDQALFLKENGFTDVHAIGHALIYLEKPSLPRIPGSILVMPPHSVPGQDNPFYQQDLEYAEYIKTLSGQFKLVCLCINSYDYSLGLWPVLRSRVPFVVEGADYSDDNAALRMACLFSQFEYVITGTFGSHVAYASLFGCKVSISGPKDKFNRSMYQNVGFYKHQPAILDILEKWYQTSFLESKYKFLFCEPKDSTTNVEWAEWQLGLNCMKTPRELRKLMRWNASGLVAYFLSVLKSSLLVRLVMAKAFVRNLFNGPI